MRKQTSSRSSIRGEKKARKEYKPECGKVPKRRRKLEDIRRGEEGINYCCDPRWSRNTGGIDRRGR